MTNISIALADMSINSMAAQAGFAASALSQLPL